MIIRFLRIKGELTELRSITPGIQLYTVREEVEQDYFGTLAKLAAMGYEQVEFFSYEGIPADEMKQALDRLNLSAHSTIMDVDALKEHLQDHIDYALAMGFSYVATYAREDYFADQASLDTLIHMLRAIADELKQYDLQLLYHPHQYEFEKQHNKITRIDLLLQGVGQDRMQLQLDTYWMKKAGADPAQLLRRYAGLVPILHLKDMKPDGEFAEIGTGILDWMGIFQAAQEAGVRYYFVEQDTSRNPLKSAQTSIHALRSMGIVKK